MSQNFKRISDLAHARYMPHQYRLRFYANIWRIAAASGPGEVKRPIGNQFSSFRLIYHCKASFPATSVMCLVSLRIPFSINGNKTGCESVT
jgi:hypothetical protein